MEVTTAGTGIGQEDKPVNEKENTILGKYLALDHDIKLELTDLKPTLQEKQVPRIISQGVRLN